MVLTKEGEVYSWGSTEGGQLGLPPSMLQENIAQELPVLQPKVIPKLQGVHIV
jgi:alpha-tubulin suppressor-like RCC1 family protein